MAANHVHNRDKTLNDSGCFSFVMPVEPRFVMRILLWLKYFGAFSRVASLE